VALDWPWTTGGELERYTTPDGVVIDPGDNDSLFYERCNSCSVSKHARSSVE
jgi:hypothetical protein